MEASSSCVPHRSKQLGEKKGDRKRARAAATRSRREAREQAALQQKQPPETSQAAAARWDEFYRTKPNLFRDRHLLRAEFPELMSEQVRAAPKRHVARLAERVAQASSQPSSEERDAACDLFMVEVGCGTGNGVFPVLRANERMFAYAFDFSQRAVQLIRSNSEYRSDRIFAFQADLSDSTTYVDVIRSLQPHGVHFVTAFWTFSALPSGKPQQDAARGLANLLADDGMLFIRDYATGDMREEKFSKQGQRVSGECDNESRLFLRGDGTYAYFFEDEELKTLFKSVGLRCELCEYIEREVENRKSLTKMQRRWLHAKFRKVV